jgi:hypothetical protein
MSGLEILLMMNVQNEQQFIQCFPPVYGQSNIINELIILSKFFKNCGKGCLLNKDKKYYYRTYIPNMEKDINLNSNNSKIFLLFYCTSDYNPKYIDIFTDNIFVLLESGAFENNNSNKLKKNISKAINDLFDIYKDINNKEEIYTEYVNNIVKKALNNDSESDILTDSNDTGSFKKRRRIDSRFFRKRENSENSLMSLRADSNASLIENIEMVKYNENDTDLTIIFKRDKSNFFLMLMKLYQKIKIINIIIFSILGVILLILIIFFIIYDNHK